MTASFWTVVCQVQWLLENYETAESVSLPRSTLYNHYIRHCTEHKLDPMNPASFGKLIRSVFPGLRTRRLGTRYLSYWFFGGNVETVVILRAVAYCVLKIIVLLLWKYLLHLIIVQQVTYAHVAWPNSAFHPSGVGKWVPVAVSTW